MLPSFVIVDDDPISNLITRQVIIEALGSNPGIRTFTKPEEALTYLSSENTGKEQYILLDINMPSMSGWEFLDKLATIDGDLISKQVIYILSSSVDVRDHDKARTHQMLRGYLVKPLSIESVRELIRKF